MRKRKHTNGCLLRLLSLCASGGFLLLVGLFGLYYLSERPNVYSEPERGSDLSIVYNEPSDWAMKEVTEEASSHLVQSQDTNSLQDTSSQKPQEDLKETGDQEAISTGTASELELETTQKDEKSQQERVSEETVQAEASAQSDTFEEVSIYDAYVLSLDEDIVDKMGDLYKDGQIDYQQVISKLFSKLSFSEQLRLLNMILSKVQTININEVWNMINDGIDEEESMKLQELVQANFTMEELDELYMYYQSIEIAGNE